MKILYYAIFTFMLVFTFTSLSLNDRDIQKILKGKVILRLHYRERTKNYLGKPYTIGMFKFEHGALYSGDFVGTDWDGNIYIFDPIDVDLHVLKRFNKRGLFMESWDPINAKRGCGVAVTKDGYIWLGLRWVVEERPNGWPIVVYRSGIKKPVMDWRYKLPKAIDEKVRAILKETGFEWKKWEELPDYDFATNDWYFAIYGPQYAQDRVAFELLAGFLRHENQIARVLWVLISSDGKYLFEAKVKTDLSYYLSPDGKIWKHDSDFNLRKWTWSKFWLWERSKERNEPLIDRTKEPWMSLIGKRSYVPIIDMDAIGNIYVFLERFIQSNKQKIIVKSNKIVVNNNREFTLIVLSRKHHLIFHLPWRPVFESQVFPDYWIHPLPDGSGFYRIEYREREAVIYFHPLPSQKR